jgi:hypothetical protein
MPRERRILRKLKIDEISCVDEPCQRDATMRLMKRAMETKMTELMSFDSLEESMQHLQDMHGISKSDAMTRARTENPKLYEKYLSAGQGPANFYKVMRGPQRYTVDELPAGSDEFIGAAKHIASRDGVTMTEALRRARVEEPALFDAYQRQ